MKHAGLCFGYGGLDMGVEAAVPSELAWYAEYDPAPSKVAALRYPGVPNHNDVTAIDWAAVEPVDILSAGYPCQPFSISGLRRGEDDPRHLWPHIANAVRQLRPRLVVLENVAGHLSLGFDVVLGDLAALGYDAEWSVVQASAVGACHRRPRLYVVAADTTRPRLQGTQRPTPTPGRREPADDLDGLATWGRWWTAIRTHAVALGRPAPPPLDGTHPNARFVEWAMMLPEGWVCDAGVSWSDQMHILGNGVVPAQAAHAIRGLLARGA